MIEVYRVYQWYIMIKIYQSLLVITSDRDNDRRFITIYHWNKDFCASNVFFFFSFNGFLDVFYGWKETFAIFVISFMFFYFCNILSSFCYICNETFLIVLVIFFWLNYKNCPWTLSFVLKIPIYFKSPYCFRSLQYNSKSWFLFEILKDFYSNVNFEKLIIEISKTM